MATIAKTAARPGEARGKPLGKPVQGRAFESRARIIEGAKTLLTEQGPAKFSMRKLAKISKVGLGTIYGYFPSWTDIVEELLEERFNLRLAILDETLAKVPRDRGLDGFVPEYFACLSDRDFWSAYDLHLQEAARSDPQLWAKFLSYEDRVAKRQAEEMAIAGSRWPSSQLIQVARTNMAVTQMLLLGSLREMMDPATRRRLLENMVLANLKLTQTGQGIAVD